MKGISWRYFLTLLAGLPADSRFMAAMAEQRRKDARRGQFTSQADLDAAMDSAYG